MTQAIGSRRAEGTPASQQPGRVTRVAARASAGVAAIAVIYLAFTTTATGQRFDDAAKLYAVTNQIHFRRLETLASFVVVASVIMVAGAHARWARRGHAAELAWTAFAVVPPWLLAELGKVTLPRHHLHATPPWIGAASFPSGHVTITASCVLAMVLLAPPQYRRLASAVAALTLMASVTLVIRSGMHRPSDVYAAPVLALTWTACLAAWCSDRRRGVGAAARAILVVAGALAVVGGALGSASLRSEAGGRQNLPAQTVINHTQYGAVLVALAIAVATCVGAYALFGPTTVPWSDYAPSDGSLPHE